MILGVLRGNYQVVSSFHAVKSQYILSNYMEKYWSTHQLLLFSIPEQLTLEVVDVNDERPTWSECVASLDVSEDADNGTHITDVLAEDRDSGERGEKRVTQI